MDAYPAWMTADWAIGVWGGLLAALLLLARTRYAFHLFALSLIAFLVMLAYTYGMSDGGKVMGQQGVLFNGVILAFCLLFTWYSWTMTKQAVLR
jgi:peptidoglycan/LPS O-acetylase OafA/YrhL